METKAQSPEIGRLFVSLSPWLRQLSEPRRACGQRGLPSLIRVRVQRAEGRRSVTVSTTAPGLRGVNQTFGQRNYCEPSLRCSECFCMDIDSVVLTYSKVIYSFLQEIGTFSFIFRQKTAPRALHPMSCSGIEQEYLGDFSIKVWSVDRIL